MARRIGGVLSQHGIKVDSLANVLPYDQQKTKIQYRVGYEHTARAIELALRGNARLVPATDLSPSFDVRLVLGKEAVSQLVSIEIPLVAPLLLLGNICKTGPRLA